MQSNHATHIVLIGGGHTHVQVLKSFALEPEPGVHLTVIAKELMAPYSGMLPGLVAGLYSYDDCHIDLVRLSKFADADLIHGVADGIDLHTKSVSITGRAPVSYDIVSIDTGITPDLSNIVGAEEHALAVKPISTFWPKWQSLAASLDARSGPKQLVIIGAGAAGFELSLAADKSFNSDAHSSKSNGVSVTLVSNEMLLPTHNGRARRLARRALAKRAITLVENDGAASVFNTSVVLASGRVLPSDATLVTTGAAAPAWFKTTNLNTTDKGFIAIGPTLQMPGDQHVFAVGDCATSLTDPREKSGVFAVRQGPPLTRNLRLVARGRNAEPFTPQNYFLTLLSLANGQAIAAKGPFAAAGRWAWLLKDYIDRKFMRAFNDLPADVEDG